MTARTILFVVFPDFQILDVAGPLAAFEIAARFAPGAYKLRVAALEAGLVPSSSGVSLPAETLKGVRGVDTLIVSGGEGARAAIADGRLVKALRALEPKVRRMSSVCSGSFLLAAAGLLDGREATTHWRGARRLQKLFPNVNVAPDRIWVRDGKYWTSAGITAGIDLALAMIADDLGPDIARETARQLVVYAQRPGGQTQHSRLLDLDRPGGRFADLHVWMRERLDEDLRVERLAAQAAMSPRTFCRLYAAETGVTPAKAVERMRIEAARAMLESGARSMGEVACKTGFGDEERMRRAFIRLFGAPPSALRRAARSSGLRA